MVDEESAPKAISVIEMGQSQVYYEKVVKTWWGVEQMIDANGERFQQSADIVFFKRLYRLGKKY